MKILCSTCYITSVFCFLWFQCSGRLGNTSMCTVCARSGKREYQQGHWSVPLICNTSMYSIFILFLCLKVVLPQNTLKQPWCAQCRWLYPPPPVKNWTRTSSTVEVVKPVTVLVVVITFHCCKRGKDIYSENHWNMVGRSLLGPLRRDLKQLTLCAATTS